MATLATSDTLRDILTVTDGDGAADAAYSRTSARSAEGVPGSHPLDTSGGDARAFTGTRKRKAVAKETERGHRPAIDNESEHVPQNASAGEDKVPLGAAAKLLDRARRFLPASDGPVEASSDLVAEDLTDWLIVLAWEAISTAVAESASAVSGKAKLRLMAWLLCDACGHEGPVLERSDAEAAGKRLQRQAERVRATAEVAKVKAARLRDKAVTVVANDKTLTAELPATLAAIEAELQVALALPRAEVYVHFPELVRELPAAAAPSVEHVDRDREFQISRSLSIQLGSDGCEFARDFATRPRPELIRELQQDDDWDDDRLLSALPHVFALAATLLRREQVQTEKLREDNERLRKKLSAAESEIEELWTDKSVLVGTVDGMREVNHDLLAVLQEMAAPCAGCRERCESFSD